MTDEISGKTVICGIIGDPIEHTMSPIMHNTAFRTIGLDFAYIPFHVRKPDLSQAVEGMKALNIRGLNVTVPHKVTVMEYLDKIDPLAERIGAVNTIVNEDGMLTGYNTDAFGFLESLQSKDIYPEDKKVLLLGAGGAARAIGFILAEEKAHITILNRKEELSWADSLAERLTDFSGREVTAGELNNDNLRKLIPETDIIVNATPVGMSPDNDKTPIPSDLLYDRLIVFDVVYNPFQTRLLREAQAAGARTVNGLEMLVWQGAVAFEKWTGKKPPVDIMLNSAKKLLER